MDNKFFDTQKRIYALLQECENGVSLDYLEKLHQEYVKFINEMRLHGSQVLTYDWSTFKDEAIVSRVPVMHGKSL